MSQVMLKIVFAILFVFNGLSLSYAEEKKMVMPEMSVEEKALMEKFQMYSTPSENHVVLSKLAGSWKVSVKHWMDSKSPVVESFGTSESKMIMGGRFLEQTFNGSFMDQPFEGRGIYGYDNIRKEYVGFWFDSMSTGVMTSTAKYDDTTKTLTENGNMTCPMTNGARDFRAATIMVDDDNYTYETFMKDQEGKEFRAMLITYRRAK